MFIKLRHLVLLFLITSVTGVSAFMFVDNRITGTAIYEPLDVLDFVKNIAKKSLEKSKEDVKDQLGEVAAEAVEAAVKDAIDNTFSNVFGGETKLIGDYSESVGIKKIYKDRVVPNVIYVEVESKNEEGEEEEEEGEEEEEEDPIIKCKIICEGEDGWEEYEE